MSNATMPVDMPVSHDTLLLIGPVFFGALMSFGLFGISTMQLYMYYINFPKDSKLIKASVYTIFLLDIFQSCAVAGMGYMLLCSGWGRDKALITLNWAFVAIPTVSGIVSAWVQGFYAWRIFKFAGWRILPCFVVLVALAQCAAALAISAVTPSLADVLQLHVLFRATIVWLGGAAVADIFIAVSMLYILFTVRRNNFQATQRVINRLIRLTVETGVATATCAILELIMFLVFSTNNIHLFFATVLCKVYSNAFMTSLNSRAMHGKETGSIEVSASRQYNSYSAPLKRATVSTGTRNPTVVHVSTVTDAYDSSSKQSIEMTKRNELHATHSDVDVDTLETP